MAILYISYDGILDQLGQSQVFPYLRNLAENHDIILISFEKKQAWQEQTFRNRVIRETRTAGIRWIPLRYHKSPRMLATSFDLILGLLVAAWQTWRYPVRIVHARSLLPAMLCMVLKYVFKTKFIFDIRGFWVDCRMEQGEWSENSSTHRVLKWLERQSLQSADVVISLTRNAANVMKKLPFLSDKSPRFEVITTCTDLQLFRPPARATPPRNPQHAFTLGYVGSVGPLYMLDAMLDCFKTLLELRPDARLIIVNLSSHDHIRERIRVHALPECKIDLKSVEYKDVISELWRMDAGICFVLPRPSMAAAAPTKVGEYLASGLPCIANVHSGDIKEILEGNNIGVCVEDFTSASYRKALMRLVVLADAPETCARCVEAAQREFSLEEGVSSYDRIYRSLDVE